MDKNFKEYLIIIITIFLSIYIDVFAKNLLELIGITPTPLGWVITSTIMILLLIMILIFTLYHKPKSKK